MIVPFNKPFHTGNELAYISESLKSNKLSGNHHYSKMVKEWMFQKHGLEGVFLTPSCTAALEMGSLLLGIGPGDEVIMPSYTFTSTANAVLIFGAKPVFCEVHPKDMNIDVSKVESLITPKTKMIIPIDYAGVPCDIADIMDIANKHGLAVMHDCAQSYGSLYKNEISGKQAHLSCYSFHDTKNFTCGEGGALIVNEAFRRERASFLMEKGTDRSRMLKGLQEKYSWVDKGSSYLLADILAAMLLSQLQAEDEIKKKRQELVNKYYDWVANLKFAQQLLVCQQDENKSSNGHIFYLILPTRNIRDRFIEKMDLSDIAAHIGYVPLHSSTMGRNLGYKTEDLPITENLSGRIVRMPIFTGMTDDEFNYTTSNATKILSSLLT